MHDLQSHPLPSDEALRTSSAAETRAEGDFDRDAGLTVETADEAGPGAFSASSQVTLVLLICLSRGLRAAVGSVVACAFGACSEV